MDSRQPATRNTMQRDLVLRTVRSLTNHPTSAEIFETIREIQPSISRATVYRNLHLLAERGEILQVESPFGADRYDFNLAPHQHATCAECGAVFDIKCDYSEDDLLDRAYKSDDITVTGCTVMYTGICADCRKKHAHERNLPDFSAAKATK